MLLRSPQSSELLAEIAAAFNAYTEAEKKAAIKKVGVSESCWRYVS